MTQQITKITSMLVDDVAASDVASGITRRRPPGDQVDNGERLPVGSFLRY